MKKKMILVCGLIDPFNPSTWQVDENSLVVMVLPGEIHYLTKEER